MPDNLVGLVKGNYFLSILALGVALSGESLAQSKGDNSAAVGDGIDSLPGLYRVPVIAQPAPRAGAGLWLNYGFTESQGEVKGAHHRLGSTLSAGGALFPYLGLAVRLDARHDLHPEDNEGKDSGTVLDWLPILRLGIPIGAFGVGLEARPRFYGATSVDKMAGPTPEGRLVFSYSDHGWVVGGFGGYRTPFNGHPNIDAERLRAGDRLALGVSRFHTVQMGLGVLKQLRPLSIFGEFTWDIQLGADAPLAFESPLRLAVGVRKTLVPGLNLQALVEASPSTRPDSGPTDVISPIEPRVAAILGLTLRWPEVSPPPPETEPEFKTPPPEEKKKQEPVQIESEPEPPPPPKEATLRIEVVDETDHPISDARVMVVIPASDDAKEQTVEIPLQELNVYLKEGLRPGKVEVSIEADLLQSYEQQVDLVPGQDNVVQVKLRKAQGLDGQLRGLVRSYSGEGIAAQISVEPGGRSVSCDESGEFVLELPPGNYTVMIEADGFAAQKRPIRIRKDGVTVLNADLHQSR